MGASSLDALITFVSERHQPPDGSIDCLFQRREMGNRNATHSQVRSPSAGVRCVFGRFPVGLLVNTTRLKWRQAWLLWSCFGFAAANDAIPQMP